MNKCPSSDKKHEIKNNINTVLKTSVCPPDCGSIILDIDNPAVDAIFSPATAAAENIMVKISPTDKPIPISDNIMINKLNPGIACISGTLITGNKKAVKLMPTIILTCKGIPLKEKKGALIKNEEIRRDAIKKITKY
tara:strand:+ start:491 stop:901 length:411 start_codon:yes stop_codon:yes gene_type:complete